MSSLWENVQLICAVCKIGVYSTFRRLCCKKPPPPRPEFSAICIGLTESGKTSLLTALCRENMDNIEPTRGFIIKAVQFNNCIMNIKEIGGGEKVRPFWKHYYRGAQSVIFVVDSASPHDEMEEAKEALSGALSNPTLRKLPCLILANCQDKQGARSEQQIRDDLDLVKSCEGRPWAVHLCTINDIQALRDGFAKLTIFLFAPEEDESSSAPAQSDNRI